MNKPKKILLSPEEFEVMDAKDVVLERNPFCPVCGDDWDEATSKYKCGTTWEPDGTYTVVPECQELGKKIDAITDEQLYEMTIQLARHYRGESLDAPVIIPTASEPDGEDGDI